MNAAPDLCSLCQEADTTSSFEKCNTMDILLSSPASSSSLKGDALPNRLYNKIAESTSSTSSQATASVSTCSPGKSATPSSSSIEQPTVKKPRNAPKSAIPRPPNAWILYRSIKVKEKNIRLEANSSQLSHDQLSSSEDHPTPSTSSTLASTPSNLASQSVLSKKVADLWKAESQEVKEIYFQMARKKKEEHERLYPNYKFTPAQRKNKNDSIDVKIENSKAVSPDQGSSIKSNSTSNKVKTRAKGPPCLYIDVNAAEQSAPFQMFLDTSITDMIASHTETNNAVPSAFDFSALEEGKTAMEFMMQEDLQSQECATTSRLPKDTSNPWTMSPLPMTPADEWTMDPKTESAMTPWTSWIMDQPMRLDPATPLNSGHSEVVVAPATEPPASTKRKRGGRKAVKKSTAGRTTYNTQSGRKGVSSMASRQTRSRSNETKISTSSPLRKLKKALKCTENDKIANVSAKKDDINTEMITIPVQEENCTEKEGTSVQCEGETQPSLSMLVRSYDCEGANSDVEEAMLCADSLIESFATMAAWSPDQAWFSGLVRDRNLDSATVQDFASFEPSSWTLFSQSCSEDLPSTSQAQVQAQSGQSFEPPFTENYLAECLQNEMHLMGYEPLSTHPFISSIETRLPDQSEDVSARRSNTQSSEWNQMPNFPVETNFDTGWSLHQQQWNGMSAQGILNSDNEGQPFSSSTPPLVQPVVDTSSESMWNLVQFDAITLPQGDHSSHDTAKDTELIQPPTSMQNLVTTTKQDVPMIELHGSFTEEQLLQKLEKIRSKS